MKLITGIIRGNLGDLIEAYQKYGCYPENINQMFENWAHFEGKKVDETTERHVTKATNPQKKYFFGVVFKKISEYAEKFGEMHSPEEWYEHYKSKGYFGYTEIMGEPTPKGLSKSTTLETNEAKGRLQREWSPRGLDIPDPNEEDYRLGKEYKPPEQTKK